MCSPFWKRRQGRVSRPMTDPKSVTMEWLMEDRIDAGAGQSLAKMTVPIGVTSEAHSHTNCTETLHVLSGRIEQRIGEALQVMDAGETCLIPVNAIHQTRNIGDKPALMMIAYSSGRRVYNKA